MKKLLLSTMLFGFMFTNTLFGQTAQKNEIRGYIADNIQHTPIPYASVVLKDSADSVLYFTSTNEQGQFDFKNVEKDFSQVYVTCVGYNSKRVNINKEKALSYVSQNMFNIGLDKSTKTLSGVEISYQSKPSKVSFDRTTYSINSTKAAAAVSIFDILKTIPGVVVDQNNNIRAKGGPATIYVNDQPAQYIYPKIEMIPTANIYKIEVVDASTYGQSGGAVINIKTKANTADGLNGIISAGAGTINTKNIEKSKLFSNLNYKYKKVLFFNNFNAENSLQYGNSTTKGDMYFNNDTLQLDNYNKYNNKSPSLYDMIGAMISAKNTTIAFATGLSQNIYQEKNLTSNSLNNNNALNNFYSNNNNNKFNQNTYGAIMYLQHNFDTLNQNIMATFAFNKNMLQNNGNTLFNQDYINGIAMDSTLNSRTIDNVNSDLIFGNIIYNKPIHENFRWNLGLNSAVVLNSKSNNNYYYGENIYLPNSQSTTVNGQKQDLYSHFGGSIKKWAFDLGLGLSYTGFNMYFTRYDLNLNDTIINLKTTYAFIQPSATITYSLNDIQSIKLSYTKSNSTVQDLNDLCNFINKQNPVRWTIGNPDLKPVSFHNLYLGYYVNKNLWNFSSEIFYRITNNDISNVNYLYSETILITQPVNILAKKSLGLDLSSWWLLNKKYEVNFSGSFYHSSVNQNSLYNQNYNIVYANQIKRKNFGYNLQLTLNGKFTKTLSSNINFNYVSRQITLQGYDFGYITSSASITKKLFNNSLYLTFSIQNIFDNLIKHGSYTNYMNQDQTTRDYSSSYKRMYYIGIQYFINKGDRGTKNFKVGN